MTSTPDAGSPHQAFHEEYDTLVRRAAAQGLTQECGRTPRDHLEALARAGPWLEDEMRDLTRLLEDGVYADSEAAARKGRDICRRLAGELPRLVAPTESGSPPAPPRRRGQGSPLLRLIVRIALGIVVVAAIGAVIFLLARVGAFTPVTTPPRTFHARVARSHARHDPWTSEREKASVRGLLARWEAPPSDATFKEVWLPEVQDPSDGVGALGWNFATGIDHRFPNLSEPFDPPLHHHYRQFVFDRVDRRGRVLPATGPLREAPREKRPRHARVHHVEARVHLERGTTVPVPTPAPDSVLVSFEPVRGANVRFFRDAGDVLCVRSDRTGDFRVRYVTATVSDYLLAPLPAEAPDPERYPPMPLPPTLRAEAEVVLERIGLPPHASYATRVRRLHAYFAGFAVAPLTPQDRRRSAYLTIALARKGTCGNRAMAFVITASAAGVPTRLVTNDVHAFPEIRLPDGSWRALELRLLDGEDGFGLKPLWLGGVLLFAALTLLLAFLALRATAPTRGATSGARTQRRAKRDRIEGVLSHRLLPLIQIALGRLANHLGAPPGDPRALTDALQADEIPSPIRQSAIVLLDLESRTPPKTRPDRYALQATYWCAKTVLVWLDEQEETA